MSNEVTCNELQWLMTFTIFLKLRLFLFSGAPGMIHGDGSGLIKLLKQSEYFFYHHWELPVNYQSQYWHPFLFQLWHTFSTAFRGMLFDAVVRAKDFIGNPTAESTINNSITKAFNNKVEVDTNGNVFR